MTTRRGAEPRVRVLVSISFKKPPNFCTFFISASSGGRDWAAGLDSAANWELNNVSRFTAAHCHKHSQRIKNSISLLSGQRLLPSWAKDGKKQNDNKIELPNSCDHDDFESFRNCDYSTDYFLCIRIKCTFVKFWLSFRLNFIKEFLQCQTLRYYAHLIT